MHGVFAATCASITVSGVRDLDGTYAVESSSYSSYSSYSSSYFGREVGTKTYAVYQDGRTWMIEDESTGGGYRVSRGVWRPATGSCRAVFIEYCPLVLVLSGASQARVSLNMTHETANCMVGYLAIKLCDSMPVRVVRKPSLPGVENCDVSHPFIPTLIPGAISHLPILFSACLNFQKSIMDGYCEIGFSVREQGN